MRKEMWDAIDINGNGYLSLAEVTGVRKEKDRKKEMYNIKKSNLTWEELRRANQKWCEIRCKKTI